MTRKGLISVAAVVAAIVAIVVAVVVSLGSGDSGGSGHGHQNVSQEKYDHYTFYGTDDNAEPAVQQEVLSWTAKHSQGPVPIDGTLTQREKANASANWEDTGTAPMSFHGTQTGNTIVFQFQGEGVPQGTFEGTIGADHHHLKLSGDLLRQTTDLSDVSQ